MQLDPDDIGEEWRKEQIIERLCDMFEEHWDKMTPTERRVRMQTFHECIQKAKLEDGLNLSKDAIELQIRRMAPRRSLDDSPELRLLAAIRGDCLWCKRVPVPHDREPSVCTLCENEFEAVEDFLSQMDDLDNPLECP